MSLQERRRDDFVVTIDHILRIESKVSNSLGPNGTFSFPDQHKIYEGLFLSAWTHWEEVLRLVLVDDLSENPNGLVQKSVRNFRTKGAPRRLAERILFHPDHPQKFVEWDFDIVKSRADQFLPQNHRFSTQLPRASDVSKLKRIRNAVAHKSDRARESFLNLVADPPFSLTPPQKKGITVGRFLATQQWNGNITLVEACQLLKQNVNHLVS